MDSTNDVLREYNNMEQNTDYDIELDTHLANQENELLSNEILTDDSDNNSN